MSFIEGDIDRPVVSQQLYNGQDLPPWSAGTDSSADHAGVLSGWHSRALDDSGCRTQVTRVGFSSACLALLGATQSCTCSLM